MGNNRRGKKFPGFLKIHKDKAMRYLYFDEQATKNPKENYEMLYDGIINSPRGYEGPAENRTIGRVLDKLEAIGKPARRNNQDVFDLGENLLGVISLEDAEFDLVMATMKAIRWTGAFSRKATAMFDWLNAAPSEQRKKPEPTAEAAPLEA